MVSWITAASLFEPEHPYAEIAAARASGILYNLSGEKFQGIHRTTEVISKPTLPSGRYGPQLIGGQMYNLPVRDCNSVQYNDNSCFVREMRLRHGPVHEVYSLTADGKEIPLDTFTIRNKSYLVKNGRNAYWDFCSTHEFVVKYKYGANPPPAGVDAAIDLANEFLLAIDGDERCRLPERISSISRQGVSIHVSDPQEYLNDGRTGIYSVDMFLRAYNPSKAKKKSKVFTPNALRQERIN